MVYRIDMQHFLNHAIDHFTRDELCHFQYAILSAKIKNGGRVSNMAKISVLYPAPEIIMNYSEYEDKSILEKEYMAMLNPSKSDPMYYSINAEFYKIFINPMKLHQDIVIICDKDENDYIDILCECLKKNYAIEVINLNELFTKGKVGPIYIDRDEIHDRGVEIARACSKETIRTLEATKEGRERLMKNHMSIKDKIRKLNELGIKVNTSDKKEINRLLIDAWIEDEDE